MTYSMCYLHAGSKLIEYSRHITESPGVDLCNRLPVINQYIILQLLHILRAAHSDIEYLLPRTVYYNIFHIRWLGRHEPIQTVVGTGREYIYVLPLLMRSSSTAKVHIYIMVLVLFPKLI